MASVGRANMNTANTPPTLGQGRDRGDAEDAGQIGAVDGRSASSGWPRTRRTPSPTTRSSSPNLEKIKLDPRPNTAKIFRVDYFRLARRRRRQAVQLLLRLDRALRRGRAAHPASRKADAESLKAFADKAGAAGTAEELRRRVRQQRRQAHRRQPGRDRRPGLQGRRQGLRRHRHDRASRSARTPAPRGSTASRAASWTSATWSR